MVAEDCKNLRNATISEYGVPIALLCYFCGWRCPCFSFAQGIVEGRIRSVKIIKPAVLALFTLTVISLRALAANDPPLPPSAMADKVVVLKSQRALLLMKSDKVLKRYVVQLGGSPVGTKIKQNDNKTPEGNYVLDWHNAKSAFYRSIHISYPNADDLTRAKKLGVQPGGALFIHGLPNGFHGHSDALGDWTAGCIAVTDAEMDEIWRAVADGTPIEIRP
jgi:L,D-transpeptidase catalytic domain